MPSTYIKHVRVTSNGFSPANDFAFYNAQLYVDSTMVSSVLFVTDASGTTAGRFFAASADVIRSGSGGVPSGKVTTFDTINGSAVLTNRIRFGTQLTNAGAVTIEFLDVDMNVIGSVTPPNGTITNDIEIGSAPPPSAPFAWTEFRGSREVA